jgi:hypothetical protein
VFGCVVLVLFSAITPAYGQVQYSIQVGAREDGAARSSLGFRADIRTNIYPDAISNHWDAFWIGSNLANGGFIQFGYELSTPIQDCSVIHLSYITNHDQTCMLLFWQYWPNMTTYITATLTSFGPTSVDINGTWHTYEIAAASNGKAWSLKLDGQLVSSADFTPVPSVSPPYVAAEQLTMGDSDRLGPVEFRNMSYLESDGWHSAEYITALVSCSELPDFKHCVIPDEYGVEDIGPNHIIAGSGIESAQEGSVLWPVYKTAYSLLEAVLLGTYHGPDSNLATHTSIGFWTILAGVLALAVLRLRKKLGGAVRRS